MLQSSTWQDYGGANSDLTQYSDLYQPRLAEQFIVGASRVANIVVPHS